MFYETEAPFEEDVIEVLKQHGWRDGLFRYPTEQELIKNWADILLSNNSEIDRLNNVPLTDGEMAQILEQIESLRTPYALNSFINGKYISIKRDNPDDELHFGKEVSLKIFDRNEIAAGDSRYQIAQQPRYPAKNSLMHDRRGDLCLLINGMPLFHIELKRSGEPVSQATGQIQKYAHEGVFTGLFRLVQIFVGMTPDEALYFANPGEKDFNQNFFFHWEDFNNEPICDGSNPGNDDWKTFLTKFLYIPMAHELIGFYTVADDSDATLKVMRSYQYFAASAISDVVAKCDWKDNTENLPGRLGGFIWHTTGSGKTMTSFKSAQLIDESHNADKVLFVMDRIELGSQSLENYRAFADDTDYIQGTNSTDTLITKLKDNDSKNSLIVTSIQKLANFASGRVGFKQDFKKLAKKRIVLVIDECHRSVFGDWLQDIRSALPNALFFGFTGTPIFEENLKKNSTTAMIFGGCLHRYTLADGLRDGNVLKFDPDPVPTFLDKDVRKVVALDKAKARTVEEALSDPKKSKAFYHYMDASKVPMAGYVDEATGKYVSGVEDFIPRTQYQKGTDHQGQVVKDILDSFPVLSHGNKYHALFATSSITEAIEYYKLLKKEAPYLNVTALFDPSEDNNPDGISKEDGLLEIIADYNDMFQKSFSLPKWQILKKDITARLSHKKPYLNIDRDREQRIDILIVVDQMLTGFDSKWINTLYLDKMLLNEAIIQAFSRTNRLAGPDKPFGTIRYYRKPHTMMRNIKKAVGLYSGERPLDLFVQKLPQNIELMDNRLYEITVIFENAGVKDFSRLPAVIEDKKKFAKEFVELNRCLEAAKCQGFTWEQTVYKFKNDDETTYEVTPNLDERTYYVLLKRYQEMFTYEPGGLPAVPYELDGHLTEIDAGFIDTNYMNSNFKKWLKALNSDDEQLAALTEELHRSFATLSQDEQGYAQLFLHDVERGEITPEEGKTLRDYITAYAHDVKSKQIAKICEALGVDHEQLERLMSLDLNESNLDEYGRFGALKDTINLEKAKAFFESKLGTSLKMHRASMKAASLLRDFLLQGGFDIDEVDYQ